MLYSSWLLKLLVRKIFFFYIEEACLCAEFADKFVMGFPKEAEKVRYIEYQLKEKQFNNKNTNNMNSKESIEKHDDWSQFGFEFSPTESYNDISEFYREISDQGYSVRFNKMSTVSSNDEV
jgi:CRISPR-associated protein Cpf1